MEFLSVFCDVFIVFLKKPLWKKIILAFLVGAVLGVLSNIL